MKKRKCKICKKRDATTRHAKDYNHKNIRMPGNCARLDDYCHRAFHLLNQKNFLDWDYMIQNKKQEIIKLADELERRYNPQRNSNFGVETLAGVDSNESSSPAGKIKAGGI